MAGEPEVVATEAPSPTDDPATGHTGGMLALVPDNVDELAVEGGLPPGELHLTLIYLGDDVTTWPPEQTAHLKALIQASGPGLDPVSARIMGHALFNPDGGAAGDKNPCVVYLVSDTPDLEPLHKWATWTTTTGENYPTPPPQHTPFIPHITAGEDTGVDELSYTGPVRFSTLRLALGDEVTDVPLGGGDQEADVPGVQAKSITFTPPKAVRDAAWDLDGPVAADVVEGKALDGNGLAWVAAHCGQAGRDWARDMLGRVEVKADMNMGRYAGGEHPKLDSIEALHKAVEEHGNCPPEDRPARVRKLRARAKELGASAHTYSRIDTLEGASTDGSGIKDVDDGDVEFKSWAPGNSEPSPIPHLAALGQAITAHPKVRDSHKAKHKKHLAAEAQRLGAGPDVHAKIGYLEPHSFFNQTKSLDDYDVEFKVTSPAPGASRLREYWARNPKGRAKWRPGSGGDFKRLRRHLAKYVHNPKILNGLTANIHKMATGVWPGKNAHTIREKPGKPLTYGIKSLVAWESVEQKTAATDVDMAELFAGIEDWGREFVTDDAEAYLAALAEIQGDTPDDDIEAPSDVERTAALAALGAKLVTDPDPQVEVSDNVQDTAPDTPDIEPGDLASLFTDAPPAVEAPA
jgi:hypothetical protein